MNTFDLSLDLSKSRNVNPIRLRQGDLNGTTIRALVFDHGALADLSGTTARWVMRLPGGEEYYRKAATVDATACTVTVEVDETQAASVPGRCRGYFQILDGSTVIASTGDVLVEVLPDALEGATVAESYDSAIQDAIDALDAEVEAIPDTVEDVLEAHPEWTTTVQDGAVTDAKLYQGKGGILARNQRLMHRLDNLLAATLPEGDSATATDAAKTPLAGLSLYGRSTQDGTPTPSSPVPIVSVAPDSDGNISLWARGKNLLNPAQAFGGTSFYTVNADGTLTVTAEDSRGWASVLLASLDAGTYTLSISGNTGGRVSLHTVSGSTETALSGFAGDGSATFTLASAGGIRVKVHQGTFPRTVRIQAEAGSTATAYQPYVETVTPIPLGGHELRSLPDGTRDELTVGADGRVTLVQRVGARTFDGTQATTWFSQNTSGNMRRVGFALPGTVTTSAGTRAGNAASDRFSVVSNQVAQQQDVTSFNIRANDTEQVVFNMPIASFATQEETLAWFAANPTEVIYELATPVTHDIGWTDAIPLCGPDLTAQAVPAAPFALTYERDLNTTLARLEAALAALA